MSENELLNRFWMHLIFVAQIFNIDMLSFRVLNLFICLDNILVLLLYLTIGIVRMLRRFWVIAHHGLVHFLRSHIVELIKILSWLKFLAFFLYLFLPNNFL